MTVLIVMGVAGCGKTTVGLGIAEHLGWNFQEGDALHPAANVAKMAGGTPLDDADRWPWLAIIAQTIDGWRAQGASGVVTCSALKRRYRDILIGDRADVRLMYLRGSRALIGERLGARKGHFMPPALLDSQFAALEEPGADERPIVLDVGPPRAEVVAAALARLAEGKG